MEAPDQFQKHLFSSDEGFRCYMSIMGHGCDGQSVTSANVSQLEARIELALLAVGSEMGRTKFRSPGAI